MRLSRVVASTVICLGFVMGSGPEARAADMTRVGTKAKKGWSQKRAVKTYLYLAGSAYQGGVFKGYQLPRKALMRRLAGINKLDAAKRKMLAEVHDMLAPIAISTGHLAIGLVELYKLHPIEVTAIREATSKDPETYDALVYGSGFLGGGVRAQWTDPAKK